MTTAKTNLKTDGKNAEGKTAVKFDKHNNTRAGSRKAVVAAQNIAKLGKVVRSITRGARVAPKKIRPIMNSIVGKPAMEAVDILTFIPRKGARMILKTLKSAIANAENNHNLSSATLVVREAHIDDAAVLKRFMPVARGSAHAIRKKSSHIRIVLGEATAETKKALKKAAKKAQRAEHAAKKGEGK